jgi:hypothetical protein
MWLLDRLRPAVIVLVYSAMAGAVVAAFFIIAFYEAFAPIAFADPGLLMLFTPLVVSFTLGMLLTDHDLIVVAYAAFLATVFSVSLILVFMFSPVLVGVAVRDPFLQAWAYPRMPPMVLLLPLILLGTVVGRGVGERILPSGEDREKREALARETREWHEQLSRAEGRSAVPPGRPKP